MEKLAKQIYIGTVFSSTNHKEGFGYQNSTATPKAIYETLVLMDVTAHLLLLLTARPDWYT